MKKISFLILTLMFMSCKSHEEMMMKKAKKDYESYHNHIRSKNFSKAVKFINPEIFIFMPKAKLVEDLDALYNIQNMEYKFYPPKEILPSNFKVFKEEEYVQLTANYIINVRFLNFVNVKHSTMVMLKTTLKENLNAKKITYNKETNVFHVEIKENLYGVFKDGWKFLVVNKTNKEFVEKIIPEEVIIELEGLYDTN